MNSPGSVLQGGALFGAVYAGRRAGVTQVQILSVPDDKVLGTFTTGLDGHFKLPKPGLTGHFKLPNSGLDGHFKLPNSGLTGFVRLRAPLPEGMVVERLVDLTESSRFLWLNFPSHVMSLYHRSHPSAGLAELEERFNAVVGTTHESQFNGTNDTTRSKFSPRVFLQAAQQAGGFAALCQSLVAAMDARTPRLFRPLSLAVALDGPGILDSQSAAANSLLSDTSTAIYANDSNRSVSKAFGRILALASMNLETYSNADSAGSEAVTFMNGLNSYDPNSSAFRGFFDPVTEAQPLLSVFADIDNAISGVLEIAQRPSTPGVFQAAAPPEVQSTLQLCRNVQNESTTILNYLSGTGQPNVLNAAAEQLTRQYLPNISSIPTSLAHYPMRQDPMTVQLNNYFSVYIAYVLKCCLAKSEVASLDYQDPALQVDTINSAGAEINAAFGQLGQIRGTSVPDTLGTDLVVVDVENQKMWYLPITLGSDLDAASLTAPGKYLATFTNWRLPSSTELQTIYDRLQEYDPGAAGDAQRTFSALGALGFTGLVNPSDDRHDNYKKYWATESLTNAGEFWNMKDGKMDYENDSAHPDWSIMLVRDIFYDADLTFRSYGVFPDALGYQQTQKFSGVIQTIEIQGSNLGGINALFPVFTNLTDYCTFTLSGDGIARYRLSGSPASTFLDIATRDGRAVYPRTLQYGSKIENNPGATVFGFQNPSFISLAVSPQYAAITRPTLPLQLVCTGFKDSKEAFRLNSNVQWRVEEVNGDPGVSVTIDSSGRLDLTNWTQAVVVRISASYSGLSDFTTLSLTP